MLLLSQTFLTNPQRFYLSHFHCHINYNLYSLNFFDIFPSTNPTHSFFLFLALQTHSLPPPDPYHIPLNESILNSSILCHYRNERDVRATGLNILFTFSSCALALNYYRAAYAKNGYVAVSGTPPLLL